MQLVDLKNSSGCIPGYQVRKGLHTGTVKIDPHKFCHLKQLCKSYDLPKRLIFRQLKTKFGNSFIGFFKTRKLTIYKMTSVRKPYTFQSLLQNKTLLPAEKFGNIDLYQQFY